MDAYNAAVGSLERNVLPGARRFIELGVQPKKDLAEIPGVEATTRRVQSPEALPPTDDAEE